MANVHHRIGVKAPLEKIQHALTTIEGLSTWWTSTTKGSTATGDTIEFWFNEAVVKMKVDESSHNKVQWTCTEIHPEWVGTQVVFMIEEEENQNIIDFWHRGWKVDSAFHAHCSMKWAVFLLSLKDALEKGQGRPFPNDIHIDHS